MKSPILLATIVGTALLPVASATTIGFSLSPSSRTVVNATGSTLSSSSLVMVGSFANELFSYNPAQSILNNFGLIAAAGGWERFTFNTATDTPNAGVTGGFNISTSPAGKLAGLATDNSAGATAADYFNGKNIYLWVFDGATVATSTQMGIYKAPSWAFPSNGGGMGDLLQLGTESSDPVLTVSGIGTVTTGQIGLIPEPSSAIFLSLGALGLMTRRRRVS